MNRDLSDDYHFLNHATESLTSLENYAEENNDSDLLKMIEVARKSLDKILSYIEATD